MPNYIDNDTTSYGNLPILPKVNATTNSAPANEQVVATEFNALTQGLIDTRTVILRQYSLMSYGADPTGTNDSSTAFTSAFSAISSTNAVLHIPIGTYKITNNVTVPLNVTLSFEDSNINIANGVVLTINGSVSAPDNAQIFQYASSLITVGGGYQYLGVTTQPVVTGTGSPNKYLTPYHFGATGNGTTDDQLALNVCFGASPNVFIPAGTFMVYAAPVVMGYTNCHLWGTGGQSIITQNTTATTFPAFGNFNNQTGYGTVVFWGGTSGLLNVEVDHIVFQGNLVADCTEATVAAGTCTPNMVLFDSGSTSDSGIARVNIHNCEFINGQLNTVWVDGDSGHAEGSEWPLARFIFNNNFITNWGYLTDENHIGSVANLHVCQITASEVVATGNQFYQTAGGFGLSGNYITCCNNVVNEYLVVGIYPADNVNLSDMTISNNIIETTMNINYQNVPYGVGDVPIGFYRAIDLFTGDGSTQPMDNIVCSGNVIKFRQGTATTPNAFGFYCTDSVATIIGNNIEFQMSTNMATSGCNLTGMELTTSTFSPIYKVIANNVRFNNTYGGTQNMEFCHGILGNAANITGLVVKIFSTHNTITGLGPSGGTAGDALDYFDPEISGEDIVAVINGDMVDGGGIRCGQIFCSSYNVPIYLASDSRSSNTNFAKTADVFESDVMRLLGASAGAGTYMTALQTPGYLRRSTVTMPFIGTVALTSGASGFVSLAGITQFSQLYGWHTGQTATSGHIGVIWGVPVAPWAADTLYGSYSDTQAGPYVIANGNIYISKVGGTSSNANGVSTVASGSNNINVNTFTGSGVLDVTTGANFDSGGGVVTVATTNGNQVVYYTGTSGNSLTGCTVNSGGSGVLNTGNSVVQAGPAGTKTNNITDGTVTWGYVASAGAATSGFYLYSSDSSDTDTIAYRIEPY